MNKHIIKLICLSVLFLQSCIIVKYNGGEDDIAPPVEISPKPEIKMSGELVKSQRGDMIAFLPEDWFFVDIPSDSNSNVFAYAVNPDYTVGLVFSTIEKNENSDYVMNQEGLLGIARLSYEEQMRKSSANLQQIGRFSVVNVGTKSFAQYDVTSNPAGGGNLSKTAVFNSTLHNYFRFSLIPLSINAKPQLSQLELDKIFRAVLATIQY